MRTGSVRAAAEGSQSDGQLGQQLLETVTQQLARWAGWPDIFCVAALVGIDVLLLTHHTEQHMFSLSVSTNITCSYVRFQKFVRPARRA